MDEQLALIESYYAVARDLNQRGSQMLEIADIIGKAADRMSEQRMQEKQPPSHSANPQQTSTGE